MESFGRKNTRYLFSFCFLLFGLYDQQSTMHMKIHEGIQDILIGKFDNTTWDVTVSKSSDNAELACDYEEADSRMFLYAAYLCNQNLNRLTILSPNTDIIVYMLSILQLNQCYFRTLVSLWKWEQQTLFSSAVLTSSIKYN